MTSADKRASPSSDILVSVVIPAFKCADALPRAIGAVQRQTLTDWEVVVVDDCSPDDVASVLEPYRSDPRIRLIAHRVNSGASAARNTGIDAARGQFIAFLDADDDWHPEKLEKQLAAVMARPDPERVFCVTRTLVRMGKGRSVLKPVRLKQADETLEEFIFQRGGFCQTSSFFVSRKAAAATKFRQLTLSEDHMFAIDLCRQGLEYLLLDEPLTVYDDEYRPSRLSVDADRAKGEAFIAEAGEILSPRSIASYRLRYLGPAILKSDPRRGLGLILEGWQQGLVTPRMIVTLALRAALPANLYQRLRTNLITR